MKVLQIGKYQEDFCGGMETAIQLLSKGIQELGINVDIYSFNNANPPQVKILNQPLSFAWHKGLKNLHTSYDLIHLHIPNLQAELSLLNLKIKSKLVITYHSPPSNFPIARHAYLHLLDKTLSKADRIIVSSKKNIFFDGLRKYQQLISVVPFGVPQSETLELNSEKGNNILYIGRLVPFKGLSYLVKCFEKIEGNLLIAGTGPEEEKLKKLSKKFRNKVIFLGDVRGKEKDKLFRISKAVVLPSISESESFGICLIEAMSYGLPLITTNLNTGVTDININGTTGYTVPIGNLDDLTNSITTLLQDDSLREKMGRASFLRYQQLFTYESYIRKHINLYLDVLERKSRRSANLNYSQYFPEQSF